MSGISMKHVKRSNSDLAVIPGGLTTLEQSLDVCLNKRFKDHVCELWSQWLMDGEKILTKGGSIQAAPLDLLCEWVDQAWDAIDPMILKIHL